MPLTDGVLIACKNGIVELTSTITSPHLDEPQPFLESVRARCLEHQLLTMTDPAILNPPDLGVASCIVSREPLHDGLKKALVSLEYIEIGEESGSQAEHSVFSRFSRARRSRLDKWQSTFLRAKARSARLGELEDTLLEKMPAGALAHVVDEGSRFLTDAARTCLQLVLVPSLEGLRQLEKAIADQGSSPRGRSSAQDRSSGKQGRLVLHPTLIRAIACFVSQCVFSVARTSRFSDDPEDEAPLQIAMPGGAFVRSDPEFRVASFIAKGNRELLSTYVESMVAQSLTATPRP